MFIADSANDYHFYLMRDYLANKLVNLLFDFFYPVYKK